jgi:hypothetical protein
MLGETQRTVQQQCRRWPVKGAVVTFELPNNGVFLDGRQKASVETDDNGQAAAPEICPIEPGDFAISVTATVKGESTPATVLQNNQARPLGRLNIGVLAGDHAKNYTKSQRATEPVVQVTGTDGGPVACARVKFQLPETGASGIFQNNQLTFGARQRGGCFDPGSPDGHHGRASVRIPVGSSLPSGQAHPGITGRGVLCN